jgi:hypothetical protein
VIKLPPFDAAADLKPPHSSCHHRPGLMAESSVAKGKVGRPLSERLAVPTCSRLNEVGPTAFSTPVQFARTIVQVATQVSLGVAALG